MLRNLFSRHGRRKDGSGKYDPWDALVEASPKAADEADRVIADAVRKVVPDLGGATRQVVLGVEQAEEAFQEIFTEIENALEVLCGRYDYRQLLFVSRLCSGLPWFRPAEDEPRYVYMRIRSADRWALRCGNRDLQHDYMRIDDGGYSIGHPPDSLFFDAVVLHVLAKFHARMVKETMVFNFMRLVSSKNGLPGPGLRLTVYGLFGRVTSNLGVGWNFRSAELQAAANIYVLRHDSYNTPLARWGMDDVPEGEPFGLACEISEDIKNEAYSGGTLFVPKPVFLDALFDYGATFRTLFQRDIGMPVEHLWAISNALARLGVETAEANEGKLANWADYTGTLPIAREELLGGTLEQMAGEELAETFPGLQVEQSLGESVARFVDLASSSASRQDNNGIRQDGIATVRAPYYSFMLHGEDTHELWIVDYFNTLSFFQGLVDRLEFAKNKKTTGLRDSDATIRTSIFDAHMAGMLGAVEGVEEALTEYREDPHLPNAKFYFEEGRETRDREIDVPMRLGEVLLAVQTWATEVDADIEAGNYKAMKDRWEKVKTKLRKTDELYTDCLLEHPDGRRCLEKEGLRYVLPVVCGPHTEPAVSFEPKFWLRYPAFDDGGQIQAPPMPRVITPMELVYFLFTTTEQELKDICEREGWKL
jgi:hypothetical protein